MSITLGDAFNRRKKLGADLESWTNRLRGAGRVQRSYRTKAVEGDGAFTAEPGTDKTSERHYTIEECRAKIAEILAEDEKLAMRISLTNQRAKAKVVDLEGNEAELTVPALLVLKTDVIPKLESVARAVPIRADGVNIIETGDGFIQHRAIRKIEEKKETLSDKGMKIEEKRTVGYDVVDVTDYGIPAREAFNEIDRIQDFAQRVKQALNEANKTPLADI